MKTQVEINNFTALCLVAWPLKKSEAGVDLVLMTSSLFLCKLLLISMRTALISLRKAGRFLSKQGHLSFKGQANEQATLRWSIP